MKRTRSRAGVKVEEKERKPKSTTRMISSPLVGVSETASTMFKHACLPTEAVSDAIQALKRQQPGLEVAEVFAAVPRGPSVGLSIEVENGNFRIYRHPGLTKGFVVVEQKGQPFFVTSFAEVVKVSMTRPREDPGRLLLMSSDLFVEFDGMLSNVSMTGFIDEKGSFEDSRQKVVVDADCFGDAVTVMVDTGEMDIVGTLVAQVAAFRVHCGSIRVSDMAVDHLVVHSKSGSDFLCASGRIRNATCDAKGTGKIRLPDVVVTINVSVEESSTVIVQSIPKNDEGPFQFTFASKKFEQM